MVPPQRMGLAAAHPAAVGLDGPLLQLSDHTAQSDGRNACDARVCLHAGPVAPRGCAAFAHGAAGHRPTPVWAALHLIAVPDRIHL